MINFSHLTFEELNFLVSFMFNWLTYLTLFIALLSSIILTPILGNLLINLYRKDSVSNDTEV